MSEKENEKDQFDEDALAALVKPSTPPSSARDEDGESDDDDGVLDLRALASSMAPPAPELSSDVGASAHSDGHASDEDDEDEDDVVGSNGAVAASTTKATPARSASANASASAGGASGKKTKSGGKKSSEKSGKSASAKASQSKKAAVAAAPVAAVAEPAPAKGNNMWIGIAIGAVVAIGAVYVMRQGDDTPEGTEVASGPPSVVHTDEEDPTLDTVGETEGAMGDPSDMDPTTEQMVDGVPPVADVGEGAVEAGDTAAQPTTTEDTATGAAARNTRTRTPRGVASASAATTGSMDATEPANTANTAAAASNTAATMATASAMETTTAAPAGLDSVLDQALGGRPAAGGTRTVATTQTPAATTTAAAPANANLPDSPSRSDVARALGHMLPQIRQCAGEQVGLANATILVRSDGSVATVSIGGNPFGGTPQGACMEGVIRRAEFSPFRQSTFRITYPFAIRAAQ